MLQLKAWRALPTTSSPPPPADADPMELGKLATTHAVGIAVDPTNRDSLLYADETALYQFDKTTGA